jgi:hypothetical protein
VLHLRTINQTTEPRSQTNLYGKVEVETAGKASLGCGQLSVGGEVTNRVTINDRVIRDSAVQLGWTHQRGAIGVLVEGVWSALGGGVVDDLVPSQPPMFQQALQDGFVPLAEHLAHVHHEPAAAQKWRIVMLGLDTAKQRIVMLGLDTARQRMAPARGTIVSRKIGGRGVTAS